MEQLQRLSARLDWISASVGKAAAWLSIPIIAVVVIDVVTRRFLTLGSVTLQELEWHLHAVLFLFCASYAYIDDTHVRVDIFRARLGKVHQAWVELIGAVLFLTPYSIVMVILGWQFVIDSYLLNEVSDAPGGMLMVRTRYSGGEEPSVVDFMLARNEAGRFQIVDLIVDGAVSQLQLRRAEFNSVLQSKGYDGLLKILRKKTDMLLAKDG